MADMDFGLSKEDIMHASYILAEKSGLKHPFKSGKAGRSEFMNPRVSVHQAQSLSVVRAKVVIK